ncbi:MAG: MauE/DoxX family redox-associated membrane protein [Candidatus Kapaibacterium sp.]
MKRFLDNPYLALIARLILGFMFIIVGIAKIHEPAVFAEEIGNYRILPEFMLNFIALLLPWLELLSGLFIIAGVRIRANTIITGALLIVFIIAVASADIRGLDINCGCYSNIAEQKVGMAKILENTGLLILAVYLYIFPNNRFSLEAFKQS